MPRKVAVKHIFGERIKRRRARAVSAWILVLIVAGAASAGEKSGTSLPPPELVGHWRGQGRIVNDWTSVQTLPVDIGIMPDGTVAGTIGYAEIAGGVYLEPKKQSAKMPGFTLSVNLDGQLLGDGVMRRAMQLYLSPANGRLTGPAQARAACSGRARGARPSGAPGGCRCAPSAWQEWTRAARSGRRIGCRISAARAFERGTATPAGGRHLMLQLSMEELYATRMARYVCAMHNGMPDRVPLRPFAAEITARHAGFTCQEVTHDYRKAFEAIIRCCHDYDWDATVPNMVYVWTGLTQAAGLTYYGVPGIDVEADVCFQYREPAEQTAFMKREEYDELIADPVRFLYETWLPRVSTEFSARGQAATFRNNLAFVKSSMAMMEYFTAFGPQVERMRRECGTVSAICGMLKAPLDILADKLRGYLGLAYDLMEIPEKVEQACRALMPHLGYLALTGADPSHQAPIPIWMHRVSKPTLKKWSKSTLGHNAKNIARAVSWVFGGAFIGGLAWFFGRAADKLLSHWKGRVSTTPATPTTPIVDVVKPIFNADSPKSPSSPSKEKKEEKKDVEAPVKKEDGKVDVVVVKKEDSKVDETESDESESVSDGSSESISDDTESYDDNIVDVIVEDGIDTPTEDLSSSSATMHQIETDKIMMGIPNIGNTCWLNSSLKFIASTDHYDKFLELDLNKEYSDEELNAQNALYGNKKLFRDEEIEVLAPLQASLVKVIKELRKGESGILDQSFVVDLVENIIKANVFPNDGETGAPQHPGHGHLDALEFMGQLLSKFKFPLEKSLEASNDSTEIKEQCIQFMDIYRAVPGLTPTGVIKFTNIQNFKPELPLLTLPDFLKLKTLNVPATVCAVEDVEDFNADANLKTLLPDEIPKDLKGVTIRKQMVCISAPESLILRFDRVMLGRKVNCDIDMDKTGRLELPVFDVNTVSLTENEDGFELQPKEITTYQVESAMVHMGTPSFGHWVFYERNHDGTFTYHSDSSVYKISEKSAIEGFKKASMLRLSKVEAKPVKD